MIIMEVSYISDYNAVTSHNLFTVSSRPSIKFTDHSPLLRQQSSQTGRAFFQAAEPVFEARASQPVTAAKYSFSKDRPVVAGSS